MSFVGLHPADEEALHPLYSTWTASCDGLPFFTSPSSGCKKVLSASDAAGGFLSCQTRVEGATVDRSCWESRRAQLSGGHKTRQQLRQSPARALAGASFGSSRCSGLGFETLALQALERSVVHFLVVLGRALSLTAGTIPVFSGRDGSRRTGRATGRATPTRAALGLAARLTLVVTSGGSLDILHSSKTRQVLRQREILLEAHSLRTLQFTVLQLCWGKPRAAKREATREVCR